MIFFSEQLRNSVLCSSIIINKGEVSHGNFKGVLENIGILEERSGFVDNNS